MQFLDADRRLRVQYKNAIYHLSSRGVLRTSVFRDDDDRVRFFDRCRETVDRFGWRVYSAVQMTNHFHLTFKTPEPNLCQGAQYLLGPYARQFNRVHARSGHVFEGRYRCRVIENESYLWSVLRYNFLNPVPVIVDHPAAWPWSSYPGLRDVRARLPWVCYDELLEAWAAEFGSSQSFCEFVEKQLLSPTEDYPDLIDGWIIGSSAFAKRIRKLISPNSNEPNVRRARSRPFLTLDAVVQEVAQEFGIEPAQLGKKASRHPARRMVAVLAKQMTTATLEDIAKILGLAGRDSVPKLANPEPIMKSSQQAKQLDAIMKRLNAPQENRLT